jgi:hypothetical protein
MLWFWTKACRGDFYVDTEYSHLHFHISSYPQAPREGWVSQIPILTSSTINNQKKIIPDRIYAYLSTSSHRSWWLCISTDAGARTQPIFLNTNHQADIFPRGGAHRLHSCRILKFNLSQKTSGFIRTRCYRWHSQQGLYLCIVSMSTLQLQY